MNEGLPISRLLQGTEVLTPEEISAMRSKLFALLTDPAVPFGVFGILPRELNGANPMYDQKLV